MRQTEVNAQYLRARVEADFLRYAAIYEQSQTGQTFGTPWSKEKIRVEVEKMVALLVDPYSVEYECGDDLLPPEERLTGIRSAFVVAEDGSYWLLYDHEAKDFVLAFKHSDGRLTAWGIRGDATSTFLAR